MKKSDARPNVDVVLFDDREELAAWVVDCGWCRVSQLEEAYEAYRRAGATDKACYRVLWENVSREMIFCEAERKAVKQVIAAAENTLRGIRTEYDEDFYAEWIWIADAFGQPLLLAATMEGLYTSNFLRFCDRESPSVLHYNGLCMRGYDNTFRLMKMHPAYTRYLFENPRLLLPALEAAKKGRRRGFAARARTDCRTFLVPFVGTGASNRSYPDPKQIDCAKSIPLYKNRGYGLVDGAIRLGRSRTLINRMHNGAMDEWHHHRFVKLRLKKDGSGEFSTCRGGQGMESEIQFDDTLNERRKGETIWMLVVDCPPKRRWESDALQFALKSGHFTSQTVHYLIGALPIVIPHRDIGCTTHCYCIKNDVDARTVELTEGWEALETFRAALDKIERVGEKESWEREGPEQEIQIRLRRN